MISRHLASPIRREKKSILLLGPRQSGKSTLIHSLNPELTINLAEEDTFLEFLKDPSLLKRRIGKHQTILIDEIQRIPSLLNTLQALIDNHPQLKFYLTGSSARKLKRGNANLLPGRVLTYSLGPFCPSELKTKFDLDRAIIRGLLPEPYLVEDQRSAEKLLRSYASTYLREEVQAEALTRNLEGFSRFFDVALSHSGEFIDFSKFASQASIERTSAKRYFEILCDTLVVHAIEPFARSQKRRLIQHPKYYFFDVGVLNGGLANFIVSNDRKGKLFEHLVLQCIFSEFKARDEEIRISVYRTERGAEVDFIVETAKSLYAIEVKASRNLGRQDLSGLNSFQEFYKKPCERIIVYLGDHAQYFENGITAYPFLDAIKLFSGS